jgi:hypothetical protein
MSAVGSSSERYNVEVPKSLLKIAPPNYATLN